MQYTVEPKEVHYESGQSRAEYCKNHSFRLENVGAKLLEWRHEEALEDECHVEYYQEDLNEGPQYGLPVGMLRPVIQYIFFIYTVYK